ncbi:aquaporin AQPAe.a [Trichonephila inaurata madagascariensis]|uniref:Aquaporin AQPAe.a n=1 Tax=Trichonephila inaurata madagascariensis TaxID=2747483 RepID=A0A8X6YTW0_9ARAC|nr:aquaporin AQPAe.a [Trichonephila inaurata madagascariensis]
MGRVSEFRSVCGMEELGALNQLCKAVLAEFLGTALLVLVGCGSCIGGWGENTSPTIVQIALAFGVTVATIAQCIGGVSGGHINPAVTCAMMITGRCSFIRSGLYIVGQCCGAIAGAALLKAITPEAQRGALGSTLVNEGLTSVQGLGVEFCITFVLVLTVFAACDEHRLDVQGSVPLAIGLSITACHCFAIRYTGSSMNTARSFGPAVMTGLWENHWVYWVGPILGGITAGLLYQHVFACPPPEPEHIERLKLQSLLKIREKEIITDRTTCI